MLGLVVWAFAAHTLKANLPKWRVRVPNLFKDYEVDPHRETDGVEITIAGATFICRRAGGSNRRYRAAIAMAFSVPEVNKRAHSDDRLEAIAVEDDVTLDVYAEAVVIGWRDVLDRNDEPLEFNKENFMDLMVACPDIWLELRTATRDLNNFRITKAKELGEELGKS